MNGKKNQHDPMALWIPRTILSLKLTYSLGLCYENIVQIKLEDQIVTKETWFKMLDELPEDHMVYHLSIRTGKNYNDIKIWCFDA